jgi:hypothetical protein
MNTAQAIMAGFDVNELDNPNVQEVTHKVAVIEDEDDNPISGFVIVGKNSPQYQEAANAIRTENIKRGSKRKKQLDGSTDEGAAVIARTVKANEKTIALAVVIDWFGFNSNGQAIPFDKAMVEKMFEKKPQWQAQVNAALETDANFMKASSPG